MEDSVDIVYLTLEDALALYAAITGGTSAEAANLLRSEPALDGALAREPPQRQHPLPATTGRPFERRVAYSACMRQNGVPNVPDPSVQGNLLIAPSDDINPASPQYKRAQSACEKFCPESTSGARMTPAQRAKALAA